MEGLCAQMINQPETTGPETSQGKVILPAYSDQMRGNGLNTHHVRPDQLIRPTTPPPPKGPFARLGYFWRKDPAHKVLILAVGVMLIAGLLSVSLVSGAVLHNPNFFSLNSAFSQVPPTAIVPTGTVDLRPTFPPPAGGQGSGSSSQPPAQGTPTLQPTISSSPTAQPTSGNGILTLQITDLPHHVMNNSVVNVGVNASEPNVSVTLYISYNAPPYRGSAGPSITDGSGNASIAWSVAVFKFGGARAVVVAIARDSNGQQAQSQPVTVGIGGFGG